MTAAFDRPVRVVPVVDRRQLASFIDFPWSVYAGDDDWVPPLKLDMRKAFDPSKHPFHQHSEAQPFLALRGDRPVGRICAIRNRNHEAFHEESVGFFGFFESIDDPMVARALFDEVRAWLSARGLAVMRGPTSFSTNEVAGFFVDGEQGPPVLMMAYNPRYYLDLVEGYGFEKSRDLYAWLLTSEQANPEYLLRAEKLVRRRSRAGIRTLDRSRFDEELRLVRDLYNAAWERNWGFVPMTDAEFDFMAAELKPILDPGLALFVESDRGETLGFALALPDFNQVLRRMNGKLFPFGLAKAMYYKRKIDTLRVLILGLLEPHRGKGIDTLLYMAIIRNGLERGITRGEMSWILEDNHKMNAAIERMGARLYRRYRLYDIDV
jgi:GNAT superfamily N-acetyltransferase